jgi:predicted phosphodiesterase
MIATRVAAIYDIHGNLPALEAVLDDIRRAEMDLVVVGGDVVLGPMPNETLACLMDLRIPVHFIQGNCDREVVAQMRGVESGPLPEQIRGVVRWVARQLQPRDENVLAGWPATVGLVIDGLGRVLFCHATPRNDSEIFTRLTSDDRLLPVFDGVDEALVVCGHTHMQFDRMVGRTRVVNAGSVGMPFGEPGAYWVELGPDVRLRRTSYDLTQAAERVRATNYPQAEEFATRSILQPPSEDAILASFAKAELR